MFCILVPVKRHGSLRSKPLILKHSPSQPMVFLSENPKKLNQKPQSPYLSSLEVLLRLRRHPSIQCSFRRRYRAVSRLFKVHSGLLIDGASVTPFAFAAMVGEESTVLRVLVGIC